ncbi:hypothetical protein CNR22_11385 [Sphingobacteriaceae bacterium]|nr:hypothetical protein CNR22_11385 [Sphingobacteriaceae bacterium]
MRIDDFLKLGFSVNKHTLNSKAIKKELNTLQELYNDHFKLQRDKYGAHFQYLDFGKRLEAWSDINADKASFFTKVPIDIYGQFNFVPGFIPYLPATITLGITSKIIDVNEKFNLEQIPSIASDILSLTRPNSGGLLNFSMIHTKAGVLKSLELLIDYEWTMIEQLKNDTDIVAPFIKLFITDLLSYVDNFFTRTDITDTSSQYEAGFDFHITSNIDDGTREADEILAQFKLNFKLNDHISELRYARNKVCGHIDTTFTVSELEEIINGITLTKFHEFYQRLKAIFKSVCHTTDYLTQYLFDPFQKLQGVEKMVALEISSFDGEPFPETPSSYKSPNDINLYEEQYRQWIETKSDSARSHFWNCFVDSDVIDRVKVVIPTLSGSESYHYHSFRKVHAFFENKLLDVGIAITDKIAIIELFLQCRSGNPETLAHLLDKTYPSDINLRLYFIKALGQLSRNRSEETFQRCIEIFNTTNLQGKCVAMKALFGIDLSARRSSTGKHSADSSNYSSHIKSILSSHANLFEKLSLSLVLLSEYVFGHHHLSDSLEHFYKEFFFDCFLQSSNQFFQPLLKIEDNRIRLNEIQDTLVTNRFTTLVGTLSDFMEEKGFNIQATILRKLVVQNHILHSGNDNLELHNLSVIYFKLKDIDTAIKIALYLTEKNAHQVTYNYLLLDLYRHNVKYTAEFNMLKSKVLTTFNLTDEERQDFESIEMTA